MAFDETRFPTDIAFGSSGGPEFSTDVTVTAGGHEQRNANWQVARARYNVAQGVKTQTQLDELIAFFRARKGRARGFRFKDWTDFRALGQQLGLADGVRTQFPLMKHYVSGGQAETRLISKPVAGSVAVFVDGVLQSAGVTTDPQTGVVSFAVAPADGTSISADFEFDVPVRFDTDHLSARLENYGVYGWADIPLIETRVN